MYNKDGLQFETLLAFKEEKLWGIRVFVTDTSKTTGDLFGKILGHNSQISGTGKATGSAYCPGYKAFQGVIWENEDTFEFMCQFKSKESTVRMARVGKEYMPDSQKLCNLIKLLDSETWD